MSRNRDDIAPPEGYTHRRSRMTLLRWHRPPEGLVEDRADRAAQVVSAAVAVGLALMGAVCFALWASG